jgi:hypothetical protein
VKSDTAVSEEYRVRRVYDDCVAERNLALLDSCYIAPGAFSKFGLYSACALRLNRGLFFRQGCTAC